MKLIELAMHLLLIGFILTMIVFKTIDDNFQPTNWQMLSGIIIFITNISIEIKDARDKILERIG